MSKKQKQYSTEVRAYAHGYNDGRSVGIYSRVYDGFPKEEAAYAAGFEAGEQAERPNRLKASGEYWEDNEPDFPADESITQDQYIETYAIGYYHGRIGDNPNELYHGDDALCEAYTKGYDSGIDVYNDIHLPKPVRPEGWEPTTKQERLEKDGWVVGDAEDFLEDFPEHEGLDNQDCVVNLHEDEIVKKVVDQWNLNEFEWEDDDFPTIAIQIKDGQVYEAFSDTPVNVYIIDEFTAPANFPEGLTLDEHGNLTTATKWNWNNVYYQN